MKLHLLSVPLRGGSRAVGMGIGGYVIGQIGGSFLASRGILRFSRPAIPVLLAVLFGLIALLYEVLYYRRFEYELTSSTLDIRSGVFSRRDREIPLGRVQNVDIERSLFVRLLGIAAINVETAGGGSTEAQLTYVHIDEARRLQEGIQANKRRLQAGKSNESTEQTTPERELLFELDDRDLLIYSVLSFDPRVLSVLFLVIPSVSPILTRDFDPIGVTVLLALGLLGAIMVAIGVWITSAFTRFVQFYGFKLHRVDDDLRYERGLLRRYDGSIPLEKVQTVVIEENVLMRQFDYASLSVETAGYAPGSGPSRSSEAAVPLAKRSQLLELARNIQSVELPDFERPPRRARRRYAFRYSMAIGAIVLLGYGINRFFWSIPWYLLALLFVFVPVAAQKKWVHRGWKLVDDNSITRTGFWRRRTHVVPDFRIQTVIERQTIFQRRWRLGTVIIDTASSRSLMNSDASAIDLDATVAKELRDSVADRLQAALGSKETGVDDRD